MNWIEKRHMTLNDHNMNWEPWQFIFEVKHGKVYSIGFLIKDDMVIELAPTTSLKSCHTNQKWANPIYGKLQI